MQQDYLNLQKVGELKAAISDGRNQTVFPQCSNCKHWDKMELKTESGATVKVGKCNLIKLPFCYTLEPSSDVLTHYLGVCAGHEFKSVQYQLNAQNNSKNIVDQLEDRKSDNTKAGSPSYERNNASEANASEEKW